MEIRIYFEGTKALRTSFDNFLTELHELARQRNVTLRLIAAKDGPNNFRKALRSHPDSINLLLKDSERPFDNPAKLCQQSGIDPKLFDQVFWMVQSMELVFSGYRYPRCLLRSRVLT